MKPREFDWAKIERLMLRSFRGESMSDEEQDLTVEAHRCEPVKYKEVHQKMKAAEIDRIRSGYPQ
jgi:hypothetical protein